MQSQSSCSMASSPYLKRIERENAYLKSWACQSLPLGTNRASKYTVTLSATASPNQPAFCFRPACYLHSGCLIPAFGCPSPKSGSLISASVGPLNRRQTEIKNGSRSYGTPILSFRLPSGCPPSGRVRSHLVGWRSKRHFIPSTVFLTGLRSLRRSLRHDRLPDGIRFTGCYLGSPLIP
jgi:hypothetical protein